MTFDESGDRVGNTVRISQYQRGEFVSLSIRTSLFFKSVA